MVSVQALQCPECLLVHHPDDFHVLKEARAEALAECLDVERRTGRPFTGTGYFRPKAHG